MSSLACSTKNSEQIWYTVSQIHPILSKMPWNHLSEPTFFSRLYSKSVKRAGAAIDGFLRFQCTLIIFTRLNFFITAGADRILWQFWEMLSNGPFHELWMFHKARWWVDEPCSPQMQGLIRKWPSFVSLPWNFTFFIYRESKFWYSKKVLINCEHFIS